MKTRQKEDVRFPWLSLRQLPRTLVEEPCDPSRRPHTDGCSSVCCTGSHLRVPAQLHGDPVSTCEGWPSSHIHRQRLSLNACHYTWTRTVPRHVSLHTDKDCPWPPVTTHRQGLSQDTYHHHLHRLPQEACHCTQTRIVPSHPSLHTDKDCPRTLVTTCMYCPRMPVTSHLHGFVIGEPHSGCQIPGGISAHRLTLSCSTLCGFLEPRFPLC